MTGASDGIGLAFAHELARRDFSVILHGRNETKLKEAAAKLRQQYKVGIKILVIDAVAPHTPDFDNTILSSVEGLNLTVVIHNVGGTGDAQPEMYLFEQLSAQQRDAGIDINARFMTQLTRVLLPLLVKNQPGLMLFVSSGVTEVTSPFVFVYAAAKCYIEGFVKCLKLETEFQGHDIEFMSLTTGTVVTSSSGRKPSDESFTMPSTRTFVKASLSKVGYGSPKVTPWIGHWIQFGFMRMFPGWLQDRMLLIIVRDLKAKMAKME